MNRYIAISAFLLLAAVPALAGETADDFLIGFVVGKYRVIGQEPDGGRTYAGTVELDASAGGLKLRRLVGGREISGTGAVEKAATDGVTVLRLRFNRDGAEVEETCLVQSDLDNYARITCYLYPEKNKTALPGIEAMFIDRPEE